MKTSRELNDGVKLSGTWRTWDVNYGYWGVVDDATAWCTGTLEPNTEEAARTVWAVRERITQELESRFGVGVRERLRVTVEPGMLRISDYDWGRWSFDVFLEGG